MISKARLGILLTTTMLIAQGCGRAPEFKGKASWYTAESAQAEGNSGLYTASGERYVEGDLTCALPRTDFGKNYAVCTQAHPMRCTVVRHNDYGPSAKMQDAGRIIDLSPAAFMMLAPLDQGLVEVTVKEI